MRFGEELAHLLKQKGMDQITLARALKVDAGYLSRVITGANRYTPAEDRIAQIAKAVGASKEEADKLFFAAQKLPPDIEDRMWATPKIFDLIRRHTNAPSSKSN